MKVYLLNPPFVSNGKTLSKFHRCERWQRHSDQAGRILERIREEEPDEACRAIIEKLDAMPLVNSPSEN